MSTDTAFNKIEPAMHGQALAACPLCGSPSEMWERVENGAAAKNVCCSHGDPLASIPDAGLISAGCPLYTPPEGYYRATYREAARVWNSAAAEFVHMRAVAGTQKVLPERQHLQYELCKVESGGLDMRVTSDALVFAAAHHPAFWDGQSGHDVPNVKVSDPSAFAREVASAINVEAEDGSTLLTRMLDKAISNAVESGCEGVEHE